MCVCVCLKVKEQILEILYSRPRTRWKTADGGGGLGIKKKKNHPAGGLSFPVFSHRLCIYSLCISSDARRFCPIPTTIWLWFNHEKSPRGDITTNTDRQPHTIHIHKEPIDAFYFFWQKNRAVCPLEDSGNILTIYILMARNITPSPILEFFFSPKGDKYFFIYSLDILSCWCTSSFHAELYSEKRYKKIVSLSDGELQSTKNLGFFFFSVIKK